MSEEVPHEISNEEKIIKRLDDLIWINAVIASELIQITETNVRNIQGKHGSITKHCVDEHGNLLKKVLQIVDEYKPEAKDILNEHIKYQLPEYPQQ